MSEQDSKVISLIKETQTLLEAAVDKFREIDRFDEFCEVYVCLDCRKISTNWEETWGCSEKGHTFFALVKWDDYDVFPVLDYIKWILKQVGGA